MLELLDISVDTLAILFVFAFIDEIDEIEVFNSLTLLASPLMVVTDIKLPVVLAIVTTSPRILEVELILALDLLYTVTPPLTLEVAVILEVAYIYSLVLALILEEHDILADKSTTFTPNSEGNSNPNLILCYYAKVTLKFPASNTKESSVSIALLLSKAP